MKKIILFGTGREREKYEGYLKIIGIEPYCYTDNNPQKWGSFINGKKVIQPDELKNIDCQILISCGYIDEITLQLDEMGMKSSILDYQSLFKKVVDNYAYNYIGKANQLNKNQYTQILVDAFDGIGWGGMEIWSYKVGAELLRRNYPVLIYGSDWQVKQDESTERIIKRFELKRQDFFGTVQPLIDDMEKRLPFVLINNWTEHVFAAAYILKCKYPDDVSIVSIAHNDCGAIYEKQSVWHNTFDKIAGVSQKINRELEKKCGIPHNKLYYKENFISKFCEKEAAIRLSDAPLQIGWGGRIEIQQKRADLLFDFIDELQKSGINYKLNIAGDGMFLDSLIEFVNGNKLEEKVNVLGALKPEDMQNFWLKQHVYINLSDYEGSSLAMLEAMSCGTVPVVTEVSGTDEFVINGVTGLSVTLADRMDMVEKIVYLFNNENLRRKMSYEAKKIVEEKCVFSNYIDYVEQLIKSEE